MLNLGCSQYIQNPFFKDFGVKSGGADCVFLLIIHGCICCVFFENLVPIKSTMYSGISPSISQNSSNIQDAAVTSMH